MFCFDDVVEDSPAFYQGANVVLVAYWHPPQAEQVLRNAIHTAAADDLRARGFDDDAQVKWALVKKGAPADLVELGGVGGLVVFVSVH